MRSLALIALTGAACAGRLDFEFMQYVVKHNKSYATMVEYDMRKLRFVESEATIQAHNGSQNKYVLGHNKFSDRTGVEMEQMYGGAGEQGKQAPTILEAASSWVPIDWVTAGKVAAVQDQGQCGSCWAFGTVAGLESADAIQNGFLYKYSEQQLVDCSHNGENAGCGGGMAYDGYDYYQKMGPMLEQEYPYTARDGTCKYNPGSAQSLRTASPSSHVTVTQDDIDQMYSALTIKVLNVSICASAESFHLYKSGIFDDQTCGDQHNHATNVVGYGESPEGVQFWTMRNSWGADWGEDGYMQLEVQPTGNGICGIQMWPIYPVLA